LCHSGSVINGIAKRIKCFNVDVPDYFSFKIAIGFLRQAILSFDFGRCI